MNAGIVDLTPTWADILPALLAVLDNPGASPESRDMVRVELARMARIADMHVAAINQRNLT